MRVSGGASGSRTLTSSWMHFSTMHVSRNSYRPGESSSIRSTLRKNVVCVAVPRRLWGKFSRNTVAKQDELAGKMRRTCSMAPWTQSSSPSANTSPVSGESNAGVSTRPPPQRGRGGACTFGRQQARDQHADAWLHQVPVGRDEMAHEVHECCAAQGLSCVPYEAVAGWAHLRPP